MHNKQFVALIVTFVLGIGLPLISQAACNASVTATAPDSRYTNNGNGTVTDNQTGLMWAQCSEGQSSIGTACDTGVVINNFTWQQALQQAETLNNSGGFAGHTDWRLPNRNELASLVEYKCFYPAINETLFPNTPRTDGYWSSSPGTFSTFAWYVSGRDGLITVDLKSAGSSVRLVRGGL